MPAKPVAAWTAIIAFLWLAPGCESALAPRPDATPDAAPDTAVDVPVDVPSDADADAGWPPESPFQVDVTLRSTSAFTAHYPYVYYHFVEYNATEDLHDSYLYAFHVKTGEHRLLAHYVGNPQPESFHVHEETRQAFWVATRFYRTGLEFPEFRETYHLMRLSLETHELTELQTARFHTPNCERYNGRMYLFSYEPRSGWMVLQCTYLDEVGIRFDTWRANSETGELQFVVNGMDRHAFFIDTPMGIASHMMAARTTGQIEIEGYLSKVPPFQYEVWDVGGAPVPVFSVEVPSNTMSSCAPPSEDGWFVTSTLDASTGMITASGINLFTMDELAFPVVPYNQFQASRIHPMISNLWAWIEAGTQVVPSGWAVMPLGGNQEDIVLWDQERDIQRRVTAGDRIYSVPFLLPGENPPRTLVYRSSDSHTENVRLHVRDLIAAGILDETGHLLPEW